MGTPRARLHFSSLLLSLLLVSVSPGAGAQGISIPLPAAGTCGGTFAAPRPSKTEGVLMGRIIDLKTGAGLVATLVLVGQGTVWSGTSHDTGWFAAHLPPGAYTATAQRAEFKDNTRKIVIRAGKTTRVDIKLQPDRRPARTRPSGTVARSVCGPASVAHSPGDPGAPGASGGSRASGSSGAASGGSAAAGVPSGGGAIPISQPPGGPGGTPGVSPPPQAAPVPSTPGSPLTPLTLKLLHAAFTRHGNAARIAWADDGRSLFLANEEGIMSAVKIDVADPTLPRIVSTRGDSQYLWAAAQRGGMLIYYPSLGDTLQRINPVTFSSVWMKRLGAQSHAIETDGQRIFVALEGKPGKLIVLDSSGNELARATELDGWWNVYSTVFDPETQRLYIGAGEDTGKAYLGGVYIYDLQPSVPQLRGKISGASWDIAVKGTKLWRQRGRSLESWDISNVSAPRLAGAWEGGGERGPGGTMVRPQLGHMARNEDGTRLYVSYRSVTEAGNNQVLDWNAGFMIFDVSGSTPMLLHRQGWKTSTGLWLQPTSVAPSPNGRILAVSYWAFGVRLFEVVGDSVRDLGTVATTGEAHDVYVDNRGLLHVFANDSIQIVDPATGEHLGVFVTGDRLDGGWREFKEGTIVLPSARNGHGRTILRIHDGTVEYVTSLGNPGGGGTWDEIFEDPLLYSATDRGLAVQRVAAFDSQSQRYPLTTLGTLDVGGTLLGIAKHGSVVWGVGPVVGVVAIDVSTPSAPRVIFRDSFTFGVNGNHAGIVAARGRIYAGVGDGGIIIYDATTKRRTGTISGLNVNFLDQVGSDFLVVANYWYPKVMEGMVVYDLRQLPDAPPQALIFPGDAPNANFRARVINGKVYRVPLYGVDVLEIR